MGKIIFFVLFWTTFVCSGAVDITQNDIPLLDRSEIYIDKDNLALSQIIQEKKFQPYHQEYIRIGISKKSVWISLTFKNDTDSTQKKIILFGTPFLEEIYFYDETNLQTPDIKGQAHPRKDHKTQLIYYPIQLEPHSTHRYYIKVHSDYNYLNFKMTLEDEAVYREKDRYSQFINIFLVGFIFALMLYSFFVFIYIRDKSYLFYGLYLIPQLSLMMKFVGLTQLYFPKELILLDLQATIIRPYVLIIVNSLFAMHFLDIGRYRSINRVFVGLIMVSIIFIVSIILFHSPDTIALRLSSLLALFLIVFNFAVAIYVYRKGYKQARLYITGFAIVFVSYVCLITDSMGFTSVLLDYPSLFLWATAFEALVLSLAFADRYVILQKEKEETYELFIKESKDREETIASEVKEKTKQLSSAIETKELLLQEVHHRVKNNLQLILSLIQLQSQGLKDKVYLALLADIGNRVNAIAKTYEMLIMDGDLQRIDMKLYVESLVENISKGFHSKTDIQLITDIHAILPLKEAAYIGLIVNEIVTNAYKYAFVEDKGKITIAFYADNQGCYTLIIEDNGKGFDQEEVKESLGLMLIRVLAIEQLKGKIHIESQDKTRFEISFTSLQNI